jgi:outer membrane biosynthesis protein TonB
MPWARGSYPSNIKPLDPSKLMTSPRRFSFSLAPSLLASALLAQSAFAQAPAAAPAPEPAPAIAAEVPPADPSATAAPSAPEVAAAPEVTPEPAPEPAPVDATMTAPVEAAAETPVEEVKPPPPPPYSLPFGLRPVVAGNVVRSDTAFGFYENPANGESGSAVVSMLLGSYKVTDELAPMLRLGIVSNSPPDAPAGAPVPAPDSAVSFLNPVIGATYALKLGKEFKLAPFLGIALPLGSGGGNTPDAAQVAARGAGIPTRSAMDNAMFAVNDLVIFPGVGFAYVNHGFTAQVEATLLQLTQVVGDESAQPDSSRTNFTTGVHVGYFFVPQFSFGAELRHQRWLSTPAAVKANSKARDTSTFAFGPRVHIKLAEKMFLRPGLSFAMPLDDPMAANKYKVVQLDIPFIF